MKRKKKNVYSDEEYLILQWCLDGSGKCVGNGSGSVTVATVLL